MDDDAELIGRYLHGELMAGSLLVARHSSALFGWLRWKTGSREDAEDLTQSVWSKALPNLANLEERCALRAWLFTIMRREFTNWLRARHPACSLDALRASCGETTDMLPLQPPPDAITAALDRVALQTALAQLSEEHRDTFMLRYLSQFSAPEVAAILEIPVGTVESRCHFARRHLREVLLRAEQKERDDAQTFGAIRRQAENHAGMEPTDRRPVGKKPGFKGYL